ncbi:hypothetical protein J4573_25955 [Actinomadura barringtoniae]|uniref:Uncharacterized protein n=1 Tax=Actinomadura barringtoniae TaxID=1427535 RepID=A0A939PJZ4_9ACTN|nr:hypothetical protein [Actinomadura barringtoniae]MBO2450574.1 hypothetical protein [Actinomadura barringtoniae]
MAGKKSFVAATAVAAVAAGSACVVALDGPDQANARGVAAAQAQQAPSAARDRYPHGLRGEAVTGVRQKPAKAQALSATRAGVKVTLDVLDRTGKAVDAMVELYPLAGGDSLYAEVKGGHVQGDLPAGRYAVLTHVNTKEPNGTTSAALVYLPQVKVAAGTKIMLDARKAEPVAVSVDRADAKLGEGELRVSQLIAGKRVATSYFMGLKNAYITPTGAAPGLILGIQALFTRNGAESGSPYLYNVAREFKGGIPHRPALNAKTKNLAAVRTTYGTDGRAACAGAHSGVAWADNAGAIGFFTGIGAAPAVRTEYYTPGFKWSLDWMNGKPDCQFDFDTTEVWNGTVSFPKAGSYRRSLTPAPFGPRGGVVIWGEHDGGEPALFIPMHSTGSGTSMMAPYPGATGQSILRDAKGKVVYSYDQPGAAWKWPVPKPGVYTLTVDEKRAAPLAIRQHAVWRFTVKNGKVIPLPSIVWGTPLDARSRAQAGKPQRLTITAAAKPKLWVSSDDGKTWKPLAVTGSGKKWTATLTNPQQGFVSLRALAPGVDQTVIRAYAIKK